MRSIFFEEIMEVRPHTVQGSKAKVEIGVGNTMKDPGNCDDGWFVGDSTIILGAGGIETGYLGETAASWEMLVEPSLIEQCCGGYLVVACERTHGGLHTSRKGALVRVMLNGNNRDSIGLMDKPAGHTDYFHRLPQPPQIPNVWPIEACATVYSWPVDKRHLKASGQQTVRVELEKDIAWDIDYVSIVMIKKSHRMREACKQVGYLILGAFFGGIATYVISP